MLAFIDEDVGESKHRGVGNIHFVANTCLP